MVNKCCVFGCKGNYATEEQKVSVFRFPKDPQLCKIWENRVRRENFKPTTYSRICELHFRKEDVLREAEFFDKKTGRVLRSKLPSPRLKEGAIPMILPEICPPSVQPTIMASRDSPAKKRQRLEDKLVQKAQEESLKTASEYLKKVTYSNLVELRQNLITEGTDNFWTTIFKGDCLSLIHLTDLPDVLCSVNVDSNLHTSVVFQKVALKKLGRFQFPVCIKNINEFYEILESVKMLAHSGTNENSDNTKDILSVLVTLLNKLKDNNSKNEEDKLFDFMIEQLSNLNVSKEHRRYSYEFLIFCSLIKSISPHCYRFLRNSKVFILPNESTLRRVCSEFGVNPSKEQDGGSFLNYIAQKFNILGDKDKIISLMVDEIHLRPSYDYIGGKLYGMSHDNSNAATSAFVFMIQSLLSSYKDVAHILPVSTLTAEMFHSCLKKIIVGLEEIGFKVIVVVTDNNAINRKTMSLFASPPKLNTKYSNPGCPERDFFFIFDPVHILKCVRNNWLRQKNFGTCMFYPNFDDFSLFKTASFQALKKLHEIESGKLLKYGHGLTQKALAPTSFERQNVKLALQVISNVIVEGLNLVGAENNIPHHKETADYIQIIHRWWSIMNVKTKYKGDHKLDDFQKPLVKELESDPNYNFLVHFGNWLNSWEKMDQNTGCLTKQTHLAISHTTEAMPALAKYCFDTLNFDYFLPGKIQTDPLENRFGHYRRLGGTHYNISIRQIYEGEEKMRIQTILPVALTTNGQKKLTLSFFDSNNWEDSENKCEDDSLLNSFSIAPEDVIAVQDNLPLLTYISGYAAHNLLKKIKCSHCKFTLTIEKNLDLNVQNEWISKLDRGGLKYPHPDVVCISQFVFSVVEKLFSVKYEAEFLKCKDHRCLVTALSLDILDENDIYLGMEECENHNSVYLMKKIVWVVVNILLNNFCKNRNDAILSAKLLKKESNKIKKTKQETRKLSTLEK